MRFFFRLFNFSFSETRKRGGAQLALSYRRSFQLTSLPSVRFTNCIGDLYLWCEERFLEIDPTPAPTSPCPPIPTPAHRSGRKGPMEPKIPLPQLPPPPPLRSRNTPSVKLNLGSLNRG